MALTAQQGVAVITALFAQAEATRRDIAGAWYFHESARDAALGAVRIVEDTQIALERDTLDDVLNGVRSEESWRDGAARAEQALADIRGISAHDTIAGLLTDTATATATDTAKVAASVAEASGRIASEALTIGWTALPTAAKVALVAIVAGVAVYLTARATDVLKVARGGA
jgi:hypothetical protein